MEIVINEHNEIEGFAVLGGFENGIEVPKENIPPEFTSNFNPKMYIYDDGKIINNDKYVPPAPLPEQPSRIDVLESALKEIINKNAELEKKLAKTEQDGADLLLSLTEEGVL